MRKSLAAFLPIRLNFSVTQSGAMLTPTARFGQERTLKKQALHHTIKGKKCWN